MSCGHSNPKFDGAMKEYKWRLKLIIALNAIMFIIEMGLGYVAQSQAMKADALDFLGDTLTYSISLAVIGASVRVRTNVALAKGISLLLIGTWIFLSTVYKFFYSNFPEAEIMGAVAVLALAVNLSCVILLVQFRDGDANVRSVWLCSRNDAVGNVAVLVAALGVWGTTSNLPDLIVALVMSLLFLSSSLQIIRQALSERREFELQEAT